MPGDGTLTASSPRWFRHPLWQLTDQYTPPTPAKSMIQVTQELRGWSERAACRLRSRLALIEMRAAQEAPLAVPPRHPWAADLPPQPICPRDPKGGGGRGAKVNRVGQRRVLPTLPPCLLAGPLATRLHELRAAFAINSKRLRGWRGTHDCRCRHAGCQQRYMPPSIH